MTMDFYIKEQPRVLAAILKPREEHRRLCANLANPQARQGVPGGQRHSATRRPPPRPLGGSAGRGNHRVPSHRAAHSGQQPLGGIYSQGATQQHLGRPGAAERLPQVCADGQRRKPHKLYPYTLIECGPENVGPKTKGYTSTVLICS